MGPGRVFRCRPAHPGGVRRGDVPLCLAALVGLSNALPSIDVSGGRDVVTFSMKCHAMDSKLEVEALKKANIRFNGSLVSLTMLKAINAVKQLQPEALRIINLNDRKFGFDVLSGNYNKILRLSQGTHSKEAKQDDLILWCLQSMYVLLKRGECTQNDFKVDNFIKAKDGSLSWIAQCVEASGGIQAWQSN